MNIPFSAKIFSIVLIVSLTYGYALYEKKKYEPWKTENASLILQSMPEFVAKIIETNEKIDREDLLKKYSKGVFVHFWGTWCAPCEAELPDFINFARKFENKDVGFLFLAVNDEDKKIKKFIKRFKKTMPKNIIVAHDRTGESLNKFGTVKVPETYLFNPTGKNVNKFIGAQNWDNPSYEKRVEVLLSLNSSVEKIIETH